MAGDQADEIGGEMTFPTLEKFSRSDIAQSVIYRLWLTMSRAYDKHGNSWHDFPPEYHLAKGLVHTCNAHCDITKREDGREAATGLYELDHALTRLAMATTLMNPHCEPKIEDILEIDITEQEMTHE